MTLSHCPSSDSPSIGSKILMYVHTHTHALLLRVSVLSSFTILPHFVLHPSFSHDAFFPLHVEGVVGERRGRGTCLPCVLTPVSLASRPHAPLPHCISLPRAREPVRGTAAPLMTALYTNWASLSTPSWGRFSVVCSKKYSLVTASLLSLNLAVTIHFKKSLFFLWKSNRLRTIFRLMALGREIAKPSWSIILNIPSPPRPPSTVGAGAMSRRAWDDWVHLTNPPRPHSWPRLALTCAHWPWGSPFLCPSPESLRS